MPLLVRANRSSLNIMLNIWLAHRGTVPIRQLLPNRACWVEWDLASPQQSSWTSPRTLSTIDEALLDRHSVKLGYRAALQFVASTFEKHNDKACFAVEHPGTQAVAICCMLSTAIGLPPAQRMRKCFKDISVKNFAAVSESCTRVRYLLAVHMCTSRNRYIV